LNLNFKSIIFCAFNFPGNPALKEEGTNLPEGRRKKEALSQGLKEA
jgi:hypothetical protein